VLAGLVLAGLVLAGLVLAVAEAPPEVAATIPYVPPPIAMTATPAAMDLVSLRENMWGSCHSVLFSKEWEPVPELRWKPPGRWPRDLRDKAERLLSNSY
jgi:hypothetical protein